MSSINSTKCTHFKNVVGLHVATAKNHPPKYISRYTPSKNHDVQKESQHVRHFNPLWGRCILSYYMVAVDCNIATNFFHGTWLMLAVFSGPLQLQKPLPVTNHPTNEGSEAANVCQRLSQATNGTSDHLLNVRTNDGHLLKDGHNKNRLPRFTRVQLEIWFFNDFAHRAPGKVPQMFHQQFMKEFFLFEGLGKLGVSSPGMWAKSLKYV